MKRRKLDEIVFGLSAAKEQQSGPSSEQKKHLASTSTSHNYTTPSNKSQQNMTQQMGAAHRQSSKLDPLAAYLSSQVHEQQTSLLKQHTTLQQQLAQQQQVLKMSQASSVSSVSQTQRKMYEAMMDSMAKSTAEYSGKLNASSFSQESKVNKWLAEQNALMTDQQMSADFLSVPRRRRPRVDPTLLDWKKLTGEENVSVINRTTGKKLTGTKAPQLKRIGQWLLENPAYDVDPKWADLVKERGNLTHDLQKRLPQTERKKGPGRPPMQTGENPSNQSLSSNQPSTSMAPNLSFPSLASAGLGGLNPSTLLSSLSMGNFDPKNNPLLMPFSGLPNIGALGGMGGLSNMNLTNSLFANLAGLGLPGLAGMDPSSMNDNSHSTQIPQSNSKSSKSRKSDSNTKNIPSSSANVPSSMPGSLPFFFPNPSLLYTPLGLGGLNPFSLQPGAISSAYDSLSLLNGNLNVSSPNTSQNSLSRHKTSSSRGQNSNVSTVTSSSQRQPRTSTHHLPSPTQSSTDLLENLTRAGRNLPPPDLSKNRNSRDVDNLRSLMSSMPPFNVLAAGALASGSDSKKTREQEMREALENLSKASPELFARSIPDDKKFSFPSMEMIEKTLKRPAEHNTSNERPNKRAKDMISPITIPVPPTMTKLPSTNRENLSESGIDLSGTVKAKSPEKQREKLKKMDIPQPTNVDVECDSQLLDKCDAESIDMTKQKSDMVDENDEKNGGKNRKRCRTKKTSVDENVERKNLRSNAGRAAAAAAARTKSHSPSPSPE